jgi:magnesium and cobalt transporter
MADDQPPSPGASATRITWLQRFWRGLTRPPIDRESVLEVLREARKHRVFGVEEEAMLEGVLDVSQLQVRDIMIPRSQMVVLERDASPGTLVAVIIESGHSRFPVIGEDRDEVVGILLAKDLLRFFAENGRGRFDIREVLRPAVFIPESKRLNTLLQEFRVSHNHMAIVVDEYGGVAGLVTIEDVLEQIVGEIEDEHDIDEETFIRKFSDVNYAVKALTPIEDFNEYFGTGFSDEEFDTIGGLVTAQLARLPKRGETVVLDNMSFQIVRADNRRLHLMKLTLLPEPDAVSEQGEL